MTTLQGNTVDLTLTEFSDKRISFNVDPVKALELTLKWPEFECPVHGNIGTFAAIKFKFDDEDTESAFCLKCIRDKMIAAGVQQVKRI